MSTDTTAPIPFVPLLSPISRIVRSEPVLPGESFEAYQSGLADLVRDFGAETPLQQYIAEKAFECLVWIKRYESQKQHLIFQEMMSLLGKEVFHEYVARTQKRFQKVLNGGDFQKVDRFLSGYGFTLALLQTKAMRSISDTLFHLDQHIALMTKTLAGLQSVSIKSANKPLVHERLTLQNDLLRSAVRKSEYDNTSTDKG